MRPLPDAIGVPLNILLPYGLTSTHWNVTDVSDVHAWNKELIAVTLDISNKGIPVSDEQLLNMLDIFVTFDVSNEGIALSDEQL